MKIISFWKITALLLFSGQLLAQPSEEDKSSKKGIIDELTYETHSGLPIAASKIYFSDNKFTFSGFGEMNYINYQGPVSRAGNDVELYMTDMYRFVSYAAYKPKPWLVLYAEIFAELIRDGGNESHYEFFFELFADFLLHKKFNIRAGTHQVQIGYLNNNDEPVMFYSVNRPDVERLIIPSTWIDLGLMMYGKLTDDLKWSFSVYQGLDSRSYNGATWLRRGRDDELRFNFDSFMLNSQLIYTGIKDTEMSVSGLWTPAGNNQLLNNQKVTANTFLLSSYLRHTFDNWTIMALGTYGNMAQTDQIFGLTSLANNNVGQVLGSSVYGYYLEVGYDMLPALRKNADGKKNKGSFFRSNEMKLPVFVRYERLDTHAGIHPELMDLDNFRSDLKALTIGVNFNPRKSIVVKSNYQFRWNSQPLASGELEGNRVEFGVGFIF